ncbi:HECT-domain (ubiquitin-transferase) family protein [Leishmania donovani]|uniref:HECT-type E3 ubiquitin transferase n=1 Tax=Leishmania donovani TaxID=5661 RepID=A0A504XX55_LEIDO|nr:HECT-domain (ubiquitin-transferase) family protein [Leishmania donovani]
MDPQLLVHLFDTFGADGQNGQLPWGISASDSIALEAQGDGIRFESNGREWRVLQVGTAEDEMNLPPYRGDTQLRDAARVLPPVCFAPLVSRYTRLLRDPRWEVRHVPRMMEAMLNDRVLFHLMDTSPLAPLSDSRVSAMTRWWGVMGKPVLRYENNTGRPLMSLIDGYGSPPSASSDAAEGRQGAGKEARQHQASGSRDEHCSSAREEQIGDTADSAAAATATSSRMSLEEVRQGYRDIKTVLTLIAATSAPYRCSRPPNASVSGCTARLVFCKDPSTIYLGLLLNSALRGLPRKVLCSMSVFRLIAEGWGRSPSFADILRASWEEYSDIVRDIRALLGLPDPTTETPSPPSPVASPSSFSCMSASSGASAAALSRQQPQYHRRGRRRQLPPMHLPSQHSDSGEQGRHSLLQHLGQSTAGASSPGAGVGPSTGVSSSAAIVPHTSLRQTRTTAGGRMQAVELGIPIQSSNGGGGVNEEVRQSTGNNTGDVNDFVTALLGNALHSLNGLQLRRNTANGVGAARGIMGAAGAGSSSGETDAPLGSHPGVNGSEHSSVPFKTEDANAICHESMLECAQTPELLLWWARCRLLAYQLLDNPSRVSVESTGALEYFREVWACTPLIREILEDDQEALLVASLSSPRLSTDERESEEIEAERASKKARLGALQERARRMYAALVGAVADLSKFWFSIRVAQSTVNAVASSAPETNTVWSIINATVPSRRRFQREEFSTYAEHWQYALLVDDYVTQPMCFRVSTRGRTMVTQLLHILAEYPTFYPALVARTLAMLNRREMIVAELNERLVNAVARCLRFYLPPMPPVLAVPPVQAAPTSVSACNATVAGTAETPMALRVSSAAVADVASASTDGTAAATPVTVARAPPTGAGASQRSWSSPEDSSHSSFSSEHAEDRADGDVVSGSGAAAQSTTAPSTSGGDGDASTRGGIDYEALVVMPVITVKAYDAILTCLDVLRMLVRNGHISVNPMNLLFTVPTATTASAAASASLPASVDQQAGSRAGTGGAVGSDAAVHSPVDASAASTSAGPLYEASLPKSQCDLYTLLHQLVYQTRYGPLASAALRLFSACVHYNVRDMVPLFAERGLLNTVLAIARRPRLFSEDVATAAAPLRFALDMVEENGLLVRYVPAEDAYVNAVAVRMVLPEFVEAMTVHKATHRVFSKHTEWITALTQSLTVTPAMSAASLLDIEALLDESAEACSKHEADDIYRSEDAAIDEDEGGCQVPCDAPLSPSESPASDLKTARRRPLGAFPVPAAHSSTSSTDSVASNARHNERRRPPQPIGGASHSADASAPIDVVLTRMVELHRLHLKREEVSYKTLQGAVKEMQRMLTEVLQPSPLITSRFAPALRAELSLLSQRTHEFAQAVRAGATHPHPFFGSTADGDEVTVAGQSVVAGSTSGSGAGPRTRADYLHLLVQAIEVCRTLNNFFAFFSALDWDGHQRRYRLSRRSAEQQASQQELAMVLESTVRDFHLAVNQLWSLMGSHAPLQLRGTDAAEASGSTTAAEDKERQAAQDEPDATDRRGHTLLTRARLGNPLQVYEQGNADGASSLLSYIQATIGSYLHARIFGDYLRSAPPSTRMEATLKSTVQCILHFSSRDFISAPEGAMSKTMRRRCLKAMKRVLEGPGSEAQRHSSNDSLHQPPNRAGETAGEGRGDNVDVHDGAQHSAHEAAAVERVYYHTSESPCKDVISSVLRPLSVGDGVFLRQLLEAWRFVVDALVVRASYTADDVTGLLRSLQAGTQHSSVSTGILSLYDRNAEAGTTIAPVTPAALPAAMRGRSGSEEETSAVASMDASDQILQSMLQDGRSLLNEPSTAWMTAEAWVQATTSTVGVAAAAAGNEPSPIPSSAAEVPQQADAGPVACAEAAAAGGAASAEALPHSAFSIVVPSVLANPHARGGGRHGGRRRSHGGISRGADSEDSVDSSTTLSSSLPTLTPPTALATDAVGDAAAVEGLAGSADGVGSGGSAKALQQWLFLSLFTGRRAVDQPTRNFFYLSPYRRDGHARPALPLNVTGLLRTIRNDLQAAFEDAVRGASADAGNLGPTPSDGVEDESTRQLHPSRTRAKQRNSHDSDDEEASIAADLQERLHMFRPQPRHENRAGATAGNGDGGGGHAALSSARVHTACEWFDLDPRELAAVNLPNCVNVEVCLREINFVAARRVLWELAVLGAVCTGGSGAAPEFESTPLHDMLSRAAQFMILLSRLVFAGDAESAKRASAAAGGGSFTPATAAATASLSPAAAALKDQLQRCLVYMAVLLMNFLEGCDARTRGRHCTHVESLLYCVLDVWPKLPGFPMVPHVYVAAMEAVAQLKPETLSRMSFQALAREWRDGAAKPASAATTAAATFSTDTSPRLPSPQPREREGTAAGDDDDEEGWGSDVQRSSAEEARTTIAGDGSRRFNQSPWARAGLLNNGRVGAPSPRSGPMQDRFGQYVTRLQQSRRSQLGAPLSVAHEWGRALPWVCDVAAGRIFPLDTLSETGHRLLRKRACRALWGMWTSTNAAEQQYVVAYMLNRVLSNVRENVVLLEYVGVLLTQLRGVVLVEALALTPLPRAIVKVVRQAIEEVTAEQHEEEARQQALSGTSAGAAAVAQREFRQRRRRYYARTQMTLHGQLVSFLSVFQNVRSDAPLVADALARTTATAPHVQAMGAQCSYFDATRNTFCWNGHQCHRQHVVPVNGQRGRDGEEHRFGLNTFGPGTQPASDPTQSTGQPQAHQPSQRVVRVPLSAGNADPNTAPSRPQNAYEVERRTWQDDRPRRERPSTRGYVPAAAHGNRGDEGSNSNRDGASAEAGERALPSQAALVTADAMGPENYQRLLRGEGLPWLPLSARPAPSSSSLQQLRGGLSGPRDLDYGGDDMDEEAQGVFTHLTGAFGGSRRERSPLRHRLLNPLTSADFRADPLRRSIIPHCALFVLSTSPQFPSSPVASPVSTAALPFSGVLPASAAASVTTAKVVAARLTLPRVEVVECAVDEVMVHFLLTCFSTYYTTCMHLVRTHRPAGLPALPAATYTAAGRSTAPASSRDASADVTSGCADSLSVLCAYITHIDPPNREKAMLLSGLLLTDMLRLEEDVWQHMVTVLRTTVQVHRKGRRLTDKAYAALSAHNLRLTRASANTPVEPSSPSREEGRATAATARKSFSHRKPRIQTHVCVPSANSAPHQVPSSQLADSAEQEELHADGGAAGAANNGDAEAAIAVHHYLIPISIFLANLEPYIIRHPIAFYHAFPGATAAGSRGHSPRAARRPRCGAASTPSRDFVERVQCLVQHLARSVDAGQGRATHGASMLAVVVQLPGVCEALLSPNFEVPVPAMYAELLTSTAGVRRTPVSSAEALAATAAVSGEGEGGPATSVANGDRSAPAVSRRPPVIAVPPFLALALYFCSALGEAGRSSSGGGIGGVSGHITGSVDFATAIFAHDPIAVSEVVVRTLGCLVAAVEVSAVGTAPVAEASSQAVVGADNDNTVGSDRDRNEEAVAASTRDGLAEAAALAAASAAPSPAKESEPAARQQQVEAKDRESFLRFFDHLGRLGLLDLLFRVCLLQSCEHGRDATSLLQLLAHQLLALGEFKLAEMLSPQGGAPSSLRRPYPGLHGPELANTLDWPPSQLRGAAEPPGLRHAFDHLEALLARDTLRSGGDGAVHVADNVLEITSSLAGEHGMGADRAGHDGAAARPVAPNGVEGTDTWPPMHPVRRAGGMRSVHNNSGGNEEEPNASAQGSVQQRRSPPQVLSSPPAMVGAAVPSMPEGPQQASLVPAHDDVVRGGLSDEEEHRHRRAVALATYEEAVIRSLRAEEAMEQMAAGGGDSGALSHGLAQQTAGSLTYLNDDPVGRPAATATAMERAQSFAACAYRAILLAVRPLAAHNVVETETPPLPVLHAFEEEAPAASRHSGDGNDGSADLAYRLLAEVRQRSVGTTNDSGSPSPQHHPATLRVTTTVTPTSALQQPRRRLLSSTTLPSPFSAAAGAENTPSDQVMRRGRDSRSPLDVTAPSTRTQGAAAAESASLDATSPTTAGTSQRPAPEAGNTAGAAEVQTEPTTISEADTSIDVLTARILALFAAGDANARTTSSAESLPPQVSAERASATLEQPTNTAAATAATPAPAPPAAPEPWEGTLNPQFLIEMPEDVRSEILFDSMNLLRGADEREVRGQRSRLYPGFLNSMPEDAQRHAMEVEARWVRVTGADNNASELYQTLLLVDAETRRDLLLQCDLELLRSYPEVLREATEGSGATAAATAATVASGIRTSLPALRDMETVEGVMRVLFGSPTPLYEVVNHELFLARRLYRCEVVLQALEPPTSSFISHSMSLYPGRGAEVSAPGLMLSPLRDDDAMREVMTFNHRHGVHRGGNAMARRAPPRGAQMAAASGTAGVGHYHLPQFPSLQLPPSADLVASDSSVSPLSPPPHTLPSGGGGGFAAERSASGSHAAAAPSTSLAALSESMVPVQETLYHPLALPLPDVPEDVVARCIELLRLRATAPLALPCNLLTGISCLDQELQRFMQLLMSDTSTAVRIACQLLDLMAATPTELAANRQFVKDATTLLVSLVKQNQAMVSAFFLLPDNTVDTATLKPLDAPLDAAEQRAVQHGLWNRLWRVARQHVHVPSFALALDKLLQQLLRCQRSMSTASEDNELASGADPNASEPLTETLIAHPRHPHRLRWTNIRLLSNYEDGGYVCNVCGVNPGFDYCFHCSSCQFDLCANCSRERLTLAEMQQRTRRAAALMLQNVPETVTSMMRLLRHPLCRSDVAMNVVHLMSFGLQECGARESVSLFSGDAAAAGSGGVGSATAVPPFLHSASGSLHSGTSSARVSPIQLLEQELVELADARVRALKAARDEFRQEVYAILHPRPSSNGHSAGVGVTASAPTRSQSDGDTNVSGLSGRHTWQQLSIPEGYVFDTDTVMALLVKLDIKNSEGDAIQLLFEPYVATMRSEPRAFTMLWRASQAYLLDVSTLLEHVAPKEVLPLPSCVSSILQTFCKYHLSESRLLGASSSARTLTDSRSSLAGETEHFLHASTKPSSVSDRAVRELAERPDAAQWMTAAGTRLSEEGLKSAEELQHRRLPRVVRMVLEENRTTLNTLLHWDGNLLKDSFAFLKYEPNLIDFNFKLTDFRRRLGSRRGPNILLRVNRQTCLLDSFKELQKVKSFGGQLHIRFHGEEGADAGGLTREWLQLLSEAIVDERYALFIHSQDSISFQPNPFSSVNPNHLEYFQFAGVVTGLAIAHNVPIDIHFTRAFYRHIIGHRPVFSDLQSFDPELYTNLNWIMENDVTDLGLTFAVNYDRFGSVEEAELEPNGQDTAVTNANKQQYVRLLCEFYMTKRTEDQLLRFLKGFYSVIPRREIQCFTEKELELVISGMPNIDVEDLRTHTVYEGYSSTSPQVRWFWEAVGSMSKEDLANLLQFTTGSSKVPHGGFGHLEGSNGRSLPFTISRWAVTKEDLLPQAHTCFNKIDLPVYTSAAVLKEKLMLAITYGSMGFTMV